MSLSGDLLNKTVDNSADRFTENGTSPTVTPSRYHFSYCFKDTNSTPAVRPHHNSHPFLPANPPKPPHPFLVYKSHVKCSSMLTKLWLANTGWSDYRMKKYTDNIMLASPQKQCLFKTFFPCAKYLTRHKSNLNLATQVN